MWFRFLFTRRRPVNGSNKHESIYYICFANMRIHCMTIQFRYNFVNVFFKRALFLLFRFYLPFLSRLCEWLGQSFVCMYYILYIFFLDELKNISKWKILREEIPCTKQCINQKRIDEHCFASYLSIWCFQRIWHPISCVRWQTTDYTRSRCTVAVVKRQCKRSNFPPINHDRYIRNRWALFWSFQSTAWTPYSSPAH